MSKKDGFYQAEWEQDDHLKFLHAVRLEILHNLDPCGVSE